MQLSSLAPNQPLRIRLIRNGDTAGLAFAGLFQVLRHAAAELGSERLLLELAQPGDAAEHPTHLVILIADDDIPVEYATAVLAQCRQAHCFAAVGAAVDWLKERGEIQGDANQLYELDSKPMTCCGGAAAIDFALALVKALFGDVVQAAVMETLCVTQVRAPDEPRPQARSRLQPALAEALRLMETHIEEPLNTDDIASLAGISRRQFERL